MKLGAMDYIVAGSDDAAGAGPAVCAAETRASSTSATCSGEARAARKKRLRMRTLFTRGITIPRLRWDRAIAQVGARP